MSANHQKDKRLRVTKQVYNVWDLKTPEGKGFERLLNKK